MPHGASSKNFCKFCNTFFSSKSTNFDDKIIMLEKGEAVSKNEEIATHFNNSFKGTFMQTEKALINDGLRFSKESWKFHIPTIYNFAVICL